MTVFLSVCPVDRGAPSCPDPSPERAHHQPGQPAMRQQPSVRWEPTREPSRCPTAYAEKRKYYSVLQTAPRSSAVVLLLLHPRPLELFCFSGCVGTQGRAEQHHTISVAKDAVTHKKRSLLCGPDWISSGNIKTTARTEEH